MDSSVVAKWSLPEAESAHAERLIAEVALKGAELTVFTKLYLDGFMDKLR